MMSPLLIYASLGVWFAIVAALTGAVVFTGVSLSIGTSAVLLLVGVMPLAMMLRWRGAAPPQACAIPVQPESGRPPFSV